MSSSNAALPFPFALEGLKAAGESTRLRLLAVLAEAELTVSDLTDILGQSQPRISRHLKLLADAGLVERHREASWIFYRCATEGAGRAFVSRLLALLDRQDGLLTRDRERLADVRAARAAAAQAYFSTHAKSWDEIRKLHVPEAAVEGAVREALGGEPIHSLLDLGTGTARMLELFAPEIERGIGLDLSPDMLGVARANLERAGIRHCTVRQSDIYAIPAPRDSFDVVILHQVLHFLDDAARALAEAARVLLPGGRLLVVDFAPHDLEFLRDDHAHRRLGFSHEQMRGWIEAAGLAFDTVRDLPPETTDGLTVSLFLAADRRMDMADELQQRIA